MTRADRALTLVVALVCAFALGSAGTSLEAAVDTSPDDVIDVDRSGLPISENQARKVRDQVESEQEEPSREEAKQSQGGQEEQRKKLQKQQQQQQQQSQSASPSEPSLWQWLLALLRALFPYLLGALLLGLLALVVYRKRDQLLALLAFLLDDPVDEAADEPPSREHRPLALAPENDVDAAWLRLAQAVGERTTGARTPREYETAAVRAGFDPDAVSQVTRAFEEVRYGGQPVTDDRRRRATEALARLGLGGGAR